MIRQSRSHSITLDERTLKRCLKSSSLGLKPELRSLEAAGVRDARLHDAGTRRQQCCSCSACRVGRVMEVMGWSHFGMTSRYQHMTTELMTSIAEPDRRP